MSATQLQASILAADIATAGTVPVTVLNPDGGLSNAMTFEVWGPLPAVTSLSPSFATAGGAAFTLSVSGSNFLSGAKVRWNGTDRVTTFVSSTQLQANILAADIATAGTVPVTVLNPDSGLSNAVSFRVWDPPPAITSLSPSVATAGGAAFTLTVSGANFVSGAKVRWNGTDRATTFVSSTQLQANILAADIATAGTVPVTVLNPDGGLSNTMTFEVSGWWKPAAGGQQRLRGDAVEHAGHDQRDLQRHRRRRDQCRVGRDRGLPGERHGGSERKRHGDVYPQRRLYRREHVPATRWRTSQGAVSNQATVTVTVNAASTEVVIDNGGPGTSYTGNWTVSGATGYYGANSVYARSGAKYTWSFTPTLSGSYQVSMWWTVYSTRSTAVPVDITHSGGTARVTVNQKLNGGKWNVLGTYSLIGGVTYTVTVTAPPGPPTTCADAVKFAYLGGGGNQPPVANNDSAATPLNTPVTINVISNDTDDVGINAASVAVVSSPANGAVVPNGNGTVTYTPNGGFTGVNTFKYTVADSQGAVSNQATVTVTVNAASTEVVIDNGGPGTSYTGNWMVSGATGYYGANSVYAMSGAKYTWSFTPTVSGSYQVSMWWTAYSTRSTAVPVDITHSGGTARVTVNQKLNGGKWNVLGTYSLIGGVTYTVTVTAPPSPATTCADAVKFAYLGSSGNQPPVANNDSAATPLNTPVTINVISNDTDDVGINAASVAVVSSPADGAVVPNGNGTVTYTPNGGFTGVNAFKYTVADSQGAVSNQATVTVTVNAASTEVVIDNGGPGTSYTGNWMVSGATGYYGANSVYAMSGAKYTWSFTPTVSGSYQVSMWWTAYSTRSTAVPVDITHSGGTARVTVNQKLNGGKWNVLGTYSLIGGVTYTVTVTAPPSPATTCADAVKFAGSPPAM